MIFIPNNVPSLKNSKQIGSIGSGATSRKVLLPSKTVKRYLQKMGIKKFSSTKGTVEAYKTRRNIFRESVGDYFKNVTTPCVLGFNFVRDSNRKFDQINAMQIVCDLLTAHGYIKDDNSDFLIPTPMMINGSWYSVHKERPGVWLQIIDEEIDKLCFQLEEF